MHICIYMYMCERGVGVGVGVISGFGGMEVKREGRREKGRDRMGGE